MAEAADKEELRRTLERRIARRELQIAQRGIDAPNEAHEDLEQARKRLAELDAREAIEVSQSVKQAIDAIPPEQRLHAVTAAVLNVNQQVAEVKSQVAELKTLFAVERERDQEERLKRQHETDMYRVSVEQRLGNVRAAILAQAVATVLGWIFRRRL